ncbi:hypothetical protein QYM36_010509 [Artemia franciscana]|uniref:Uncharacterized protein n=1 Tax=Artemia franciscana TaxID=6661 RepID=A0AA88HXP8_ARTSF|nr:hypothetical protein QYM36_010509 [Artemia franciscana]
MKRKKCDHRDNKSKMACEPEDSKISSNGNADRDLLQHLKNLMREDGNWERIKGDLIDVVAQYVSKPQSAPDNQSKNSTDVVSTSKDFQLVLILIEKFLLKSNFQKTKDAFKKEIEEKCIKVQEEVIKFVESDSDMNLIDMVKSKSVTDSIAQPKGEDPSKKQP